MGRLPTAPRLHCRQRLVHRCAHLRLRHEYTIFAQRSHQTGPSHLLIDRLAHADQNQPIAVRGQFVGVSTEHADERAAHLVAPAQTQDYDCAAVRPRLGQSLLQRGHRCKKQAAVHLQHHRFVVFERSRRLRLRWDTRWARG